MKMKSTYVNQSYNKAMSLLAFCLCLVLAFALFLPSTITYADYADLNENTIVNFNQYIQNSFVNYSTILPNQRSTELTLGFSLMNNHVFYIRYNIIVERGYAVEFGFRPQDENNIRTDTLGYNDNSRDFIITNVDKLSRVLAYTNGDNTKLNCMCIDLTQMFGSQFEPNLEQCREYFIADYYSYSQGTTMPYSKTYLQGYNDGANAVYDAMTITFNSYTIGNNSQTYGNNTIERGTLYFDNIYSAYTFTGVISINMLSNITRGTNININFKLWIPDTQGENDNFYKSFKLYFGYVNDNNELIQIVEIEPIPHTAPQENTYQGNFVLPIDTQNIYCWVDYNTIGDNFEPTSIIAYQTEMSFKSVDIGLLINNAYNNGASATTKEYEPGGIRYDSIYQLGVANGIAQGNTFGNGLEIIGTTFTQVFSFFNIEILPGIPLTIFILLPLLVGLIIFIVKMTKGD